MNSELESSFVAIKPDGYRRRLVGEVISRLESVGLELIGIRTMLVTADLAERHYGEHQGKPFFGSLVEFICSGPIVAMAWRGPQAIKLIRKLVGATNPLEANPGTIRGDFAKEVSENIIHASDSISSAERELAIFFPNGVDLLI